MLVAITGASGFLGRNLTSELIKNKIEYVAYDSKKFGSLCEPFVFSDFLKLYRPTHVIHLAAKVGGISSNIASPYDFIWDNLMMGLNVIESSRVIGIQKFIMISTVCGYPALCDVPFKEQDLWSGYPEGSNAPYGIAKRTLTEVLWSAHLQHGFNSTTINMANLYGPGDSEDLKNNHVIPAIFLKMLTFKRNPHVQQINLWGDGSATRDFLFVKDAANAIIKSLNTSQGPQFGINVGTGVESSIKEVAETIAILFGINRSHIKWDNSKPNGQVRRRLDITKAKQLLDWEPTTSLNSGLEILKEYYSV